MFSKKMSRYAVLVLGWVFILSLCIGLSGNIAIAENPPGFPDLPDDCGNNHLFTTDFRLEDCKFKDKGENPFFILKPGYRLVLVGGDEKSVETVLRDKKTINLGGRKIKTRVLEERAYEDGLLVEISLNWFAICKKTNAVYYFGEDSRDCAERGGFNPAETQCLEGTEEDSGDYEPDTAGSWEAGEDAMPGLIMPGTPLLGSKYFQEIAPDLEEPEDPDHAVDRGEIVFMWPENDPDLPGCINIIDTNPAEADEGGCGDDDSKIYCPGVGLVQDEDLELVCSGYGNDCDDWL